MIVRSFETPIEEGGVLDVDNHACYWYEEFATRIRRHILNGFIYALIGLHDWYQAFGDSKAQQLFQKGLVTLKRHIHEYDTGFWVKYDLVICTMCNPRYLRLHVRLLEAMFAITGDEEYEQIAKRWSSYKDRNYPRKYMLRKPMLTLKRGVNSARYILSCRPSLRPILEDLNNAWLYPDRVELRE